MRREQLHVTLRFLGEIPAPRADTVCRALHGSVALGSSFRAALGGLGGFPNEHAPRVIWAGLTTGQTPMRRLRDAVEQSLSEVGFVRDQSTFTPHVTLARVRRDAAREQVAELSGFIGDNRDRFDGEPFTVDAVTVMRSELGHGGSHYSPLARVELR